jgi:hypothetical protein
LISGAFLTRLARLTAPPLTAGYTDSENSTTVYRNRNASASGPFATESDAAIGRTIDLARALGARVVSGQGC